MHLQETAKSVVARGNRRRLLPRHEAAAGHRARPRGHAFLGAGQLHLPLRRAHRGHRGRPRNRRDRHHALRRGGRLRQHHQPADRRRPDSRRRRAGHSARRSGSRPSTTTNGQILTGEFTDYAHAARPHMMPWIESRPHDDALARESAGREGRGRSRHHRLLARHRQFGGGRACAPWRAAHRHAADAGENLERDPGRRSGMIPQEFEYHAPATLQEALAPVGRAAAPNPGRRHEPHPADEAAPGRARDSWWTSAAFPSSRRSSGGWRRLRIGAMATHYERRESSPLIRSDCPLLAAAAAYIGDVQVRNTEPSAAAWRTPTLPRTIPPRCSRSTRRSSFDRPQRRARTGVFRFPRGHVHDRARTRRDCPGVDRPSGSGDA